ALGGGREETFLENGFRPFPRTPIPSSNDFWVVEVARFPKDSSADWKVRLSFSGFPAGNPRCL
ncbi:MAG: hypothetical protein IKJ34_02300, partial [Mailhella sp.]|nr:hypothetical protein [Mailhella sp.]